MGLDLFLFFFCFESGGGSNNFIGRVCAGTCTLFGSVDVDVDEDAPSLAFADEGLGGGGGVGDGGLARAA